MLVAHRELSSALCSGQCSRLFECQLLLTQTFSKSFRRRRVIVGHPQMVMVRDVLHVSLDFTPAWLGRIRPRETLESSTSCPLVSMSTDRVVSNNDSAFLGLLSCLIPAAPTTLRDGGGGPNSLHHRPQYWCQGIRELRDSRLPRQDLRHLNVLKLRGFLTNFKGYLLSCVAWEQLLGGWTWSLCHV